MNFREDVEAILAHYRELWREAVTESGVKAKDLTAVTVPQKPSSRVLWTGPTTAQDALTQLEVTVHNVAMATRARDRQLELVRRYGEGTDELRKERRKAVLSEVGRTPAEVAALYGYPDSHKVRELRARHNLKPNDGLPREADERALTSRALDEIVEGTT